MPHIHQHIDFTVTPIIVHPAKNKVLLVNHPKYGQWMSIGGHIELDEDPDTALEREITEECGLEVEFFDQNPGFKSSSSRTLRRPRSVDIHDANPPHRHVGLVYFCIAKSSQFHQSKEHTAMRWFTKSELEDKKFDITGLTRYYAGLALKEAGQ